MLLVTCIGSGCTERAGESGTDPTTAEGWIERTYERGPFLVRLSWDRESLDVIDTLQLRWEAVADEGVEVVQPDLPAELSEDSLGVLEQFNESEQLTDDGRVRHVRQFMLEPILSGSVEIPVLIFQFQRPEDKHPADSTAEPTWHQIQTEPIKLSVTATLAADQQELEPAPNKPPLEIGRAARSYAWIIVIGGLLVAMAGLSFFLTRKRRTAVESRRRSYRAAHDLAQQRLWALEDAGLIQAGLNERYYERLSYILRWYIEHRFDLRAPERTTEEFLAEATGSGALSHQQTSLLKGFLVKCDEVKFAGLKPDISQAQELMRRAKDFVDHTAAVEKVVDVTDWNETELLARSA